jgi:ubiquitin C-terminal hydrolase
VHVDDRTGSRSDDSNPSEQQLQQQEAQQDKKSPEQELAEHPVRQRLALQEREAQKTSNQTLRDVFKRVVWSTCNSVMNLRTNRNRNRKNGDNGANNVTSSNNSNGINGNGNGNANQLPGETELERVIQWAEYEIHHDPYRGMTLKYAPSLSWTVAKQQQRSNITISSHNSKDNNHHGNNFRSNHNNPAADPSPATTTLATSAGASTAGASTTASSTCSTTTTNSTATTSNCTTPWTHCQWGSSSATTTGSAAAVSVTRNTTTSLVISSTSTSSTFDHSNHEDPEQLVRQICHCTCPSLVAWTRSRPKTGDTTNGNGSSGIGKKRGRSSSTGLAAGAMKQSPEEGPDEEEKEELEVTKWIQVNGRPVSSSGSPKSQQRKQQQPQNPLFDEHYRCICDFNPFCLGSLGGVVNDVLMDRSREVAQTVLVARRNHRRIFGNQSDGVATSRNGHSSSGSSSSSGPEEASSSSSRLLAELEATVSLSKRKKSPPVTPKTCNNNTTVSVIDLQDTENTTDFKKENDYNKNGESSRSFQVSAKQDDNENGVIVVTAVPVAEEQASMEEVDMADPECKNNSDQQVQNDEVQSKRHKTAADEAILAVADDVVVVSTETNPNDEQQQQQQQQQGDSNDNTDATVDEKGYETVEVALVIKGRQHQKGIVSPRKSTTDHINMFGNDDVFAFLGDTEEITVLETTTSVAMSVGKTSPSKRGRAQSSEDDSRNDIVVESPPLKKQKPNDSLELSLAEIVEKIFTSSDTHPGAKEVHDITNGSIVIDTPTVSVPTYSKETQEQLNELRKSLSIQVSPVRSYVYRTLGVNHIPSRSDDGPSVTLDEFMTKLRTWHQSILFVNPMEDASRNIASSSSNHDSDRWTIPLPPGIQNLGATCYLNTQLQCLAQNTAFLQGIFSWRNHQATNDDNSDTNTSKDDTMSNTNNSSKSNKNVMSSVMSELQLLLAKMVLGGAGTVSTIDFSNALGLEHDEQQDPNEFARLLFERMDESFQECAAASASTKTVETNNNTDLSNLLHRIFHGVTTYETTCMTCNCTSERSEGFMDLNLPIVKPPASTASNKNTGKENAKASSNDDGKPPAKTGGRQTTLDSLCFVGPTKPKNVDTDLQYCLDQYMSPECLDGDNQYFCSSCDGKRDAKRVPKLTELPPVLNVQLSRYVFDREKFVKQKLSDKVLLPTVLKVPKGGSVNVASGSDDNKPKCKYNRYLLCAVMRHQGTSAYRGHYVAEAMDWLTGRWFEFNDETVKLLPNGPSCSYDPSILEEDEGDMDDSSSPLQRDKRISSLSAVSGSQDAYNMYYVQDSFLAKNAISSLLQREKLCLSLTNRITDVSVVDEGTMKHDALISVSKDRDVKYSVLSE